MPGERRRQRQQRVRHEVGDAIIEPKNDELDTNNVQQKEDNDIKDRSMETFKEVGRKDRKSKNEVNEIEVATSTFDKANKGNKKAPSKENNKNRSVDTKFQRRPEKRVSTIAYADEVKEYEPVSIMESPLDAAKSNDSQKYRRREVISNWLRYDEIPIEEEYDDGTDHLLGEDFSQVLKLNATSNSGGFLHLKDEANWGSVSSDYLGAHGLGALKVADLVSALRTIPLDQKLKISEKSLPIGTVNYYKQLAADNKKLYQPNRDYSSEVDVNSKILESLKLALVEPINLSHEDKTVNLEEKVKSSSNTSATLKFSAAFSSEPDDIDMDKLIIDRESSPEDVPQICVTVQENQAAKKEKLDNIKTTNNSLLISNNYVEQINTKNSSVNYVKPKLPTPTPVTFDFGLPKTETGNLQRQGNSTKLKENLEERDIESSLEPETEEKKSDYVDVDVSTEQKNPVVLITKTETESLEDWLDSVLDD